MSVGEHEMRHDLLVYDSDDGFAGSLGLFVEEGVEAGHPVLVVTNADRREVVTDTLVGRRRREGDVLRRRSFLHAPGGGDRGLRREAARVSRRGRRGGARVRRAAGMQEARGVEVLAALRGHRRAGLRGTAGLGHLRVRHARDATARSSTTPGAFTVRCTRRAGARTRTTRNPSDACARSRARPSNSPACARCRWSGTRDAPQAARARAGRRGSGCRDRLADARGGGGGARQCGAPRRRAAQPSRRPGRRTASCARSPTAAPGSTIRSRATSRRAGAGDPARPLERAAADAAPRSALLRRAASPCGSGSDSYFTKRCTNASAVSATSRQPLSIVSACPRLRERDELGHALVLLLLLERRLRRSPAARCGPSCRT